LEPPDRAERVIRFGCGFIAGVFLIGAGSITGAMWHRQYWIAACLFVGVAFGLLAMKYGDAFWHSSWFRWLWWWLP
jgi:hypothetical protein